MPLDLWLMRVPEDTDFGLLTFETLTLVVRQLDVAQTRS
jgi:hypothetical protein